MADSQRRLALEKEKERGADLRREMRQSEKDNARTLPSIASSSIVRRPTSCPCLSPDTSSSPWSSSRKSSDEPKRVRTGGSAVLPGDDLGERVMGRIIAASWSAGFALVASRLALTLAGGDVTCKAEKVEFFNHPPRAALRHLYDRALAPGDNKLLHYLDLAQTR